MANERLELELAESKDEIIAQADFIRENERLKEILAYQEQSRNEPLVTKVVSRWENGGESIFTIDRGESDGLKAGDIVIDEKGVLVGKIYKLNQTLASVRLMTHPDFKIAVKKINDNEPLGILSGEFLISAKVELIPKDKLLETGEELVTTNIQGSQAGIRAGVITEIINQPGDLFKSAAVLPLYDLDDIIFLQVFKTSYAD
jgi:rod shape-determining protein MreC